MRFMGSEHEFDPHIPVEDVVILVTDRDNPRFGQVGALYAHDWSDLGRYHVRFNDGELVEYPDGIIKGDSPSPVRKFYRHPDGEYAAEMEKLDQGLNDFKAACFELGLDPERVGKQYFALFGRFLPK